MVDELRKWMPTRLNPLTGAMKMHHLHFSSDGKVVSRLLPEDASGTRVAIRPGWGAKVDRTVPPDFTIHPEAEVDITAEMPEE